MKTYKHSNMDYKVQDNFLPKENLENVKKEFFNNYFPWYFQEKINVNHKDDDLSYYMTHNIFINNKASGYWDLFTKNFLVFLDHKEIIRVTVNLRPRTETIQINELHVDYDYEHKAALFSLNTCDGFTSFDDKQIDSIENRILYFEGNKRHASSSCTNAKARFNININYR